MAGKRILFVFCLILLVFTTTFICFLFRPCKYLVVADDSLFQEYPLEEDVCLEKNVYVKLIKKSQSVSFQKKIFTPRYVFLAEFSVYKQVDFLQEAENKNEKFYRTDFYPLLACLESDANLSFLTVKEMKERERALSIEGLYAGDKDYKLNVYKGIKVFFFEEKVRSKLDLWCQKTFIDKSKNAQTVTITSVGDIMVERGVQEVLCTQDGIQKVFASTLPLLQQSDFTIGNLEGVVTESNQNAIKTFTFKFKKEILPKLLDAGFDYLMQTNNHCYDYGEAGFKDTMKAFEEYKIPSSGIGYNAEEAKKFYHTKIKGLPIAIISCGAFPVERSGFNGKVTATATETRVGILWHSQELLQDIKKEKEAGNFVIVNVHGGEEYHFTPSKQQRKLYQSFCESGADIVFGSHPHVLQPTEWYGKSLIVYSMGNFIFNGMENMPGGTDSVVVRVGVTNGRITYVEHYPAKIRLNGVDLKTSSNVSQFQ